MAKQLKNLTQDQSAPNAAENATPPADDLPADDAAPAGRGTDQIATLARWLQTRLPDQPWQPDPAWLQTELPAAPMPPEAVATIVVLAQAQAQIQATLAIDLQQPNRMTALRRIVATFNERAESLPDADPSAWQELAAQATNVAQVENAVAANLFAAPTPAAAQAWQLPGGQPLSQWRPFLRQVKALVPLLAAAKLLGIELAAADAAAQMAQRVRTLRQVSLPRLRAPQTVARMTALAQALAQIKQALGADPLTTDFAALQDRVTARQENLLRTLREMARSQAALPPQQQELLADDAGQIIRLPARPPSVANLATPQVIKALKAINPQQMAAMTWKVPPMATLPLIASGLPLAALLGQLGAIGISPVRQTPCGRQCDAAAALRAVDAQTDRQTDGQTGDPAGAQAVA